MDNPTFHPEAQAAADVERRPGAAPPAARVSVPISPVQTRQPMTVE